MPQERVKTTMQTNTPQSESLTSILPEPESWRQLLGTLISDPTTRSRAADQMGVGEITLKRWARGRTNPHSHMLRPLLLAFPEYSDLFVRLIKKEFPDFAPSERPTFSVTPDPTAEGEALHIPLDLYESVMTTRCTTPKTHLFWSITNHVLRPAIEQLDPHRLGMGIWIHQCLVTDVIQGTAYVTCLRERIRFGTLPWKIDLAPMLLLGAESLPGYAASRSLPAICQNIAENSNFLPIRLQDYEASSVSYPIVHGEQIAGCLTVSSTQTEYFTQVRLALIEKYAHLLSLAFNDDEFCDKNSIHLREYPSTTEQKKHFATFQQRRAEAMNDHAHPRGFEEAERLVWIQFAKKLVSNE